MQLQDMPTQLIHLHWIQTNETHVMDVETFERKI